MTQNFYNSYLQTLQAIEYCENNHLQTPALVMLYSAIDSVSWLSSSNPKASGKAFKAWVSEWMLKDPRIKCTAEELYAARCGLVHTLTPTSSLTQRGIRKVAYAWGSASSQRLEELIDSVDAASELVAVHLSDLIQVFRNGMADYLEYVSEDSQRKEAFEAKCREHFATVSMERVDEAINQLNMLNGK
ncbi:hypothetical protein [Stutzerimonas zhaodongensis]|jgi:hypothetical protein|uniref:hypothetical protein n=1 Tax=Stutzerimonas zhaodongensis TaxID=1176257 RepID=UPI001F4E5CD7|nr:hypothetical protein [Stutzerimonas zhaodongensis]UNG19680.1 hypothetical protein MKP10_05410 [Stutzerimonas zhaodongensis]